MSRFGAVTPRHAADGPHLSVYKSVCRISVRALAYFDGAESVTPKYDPASDELALIPQPGDSGLRVLNRQKHGATVFLRSIMQSRSIGIDTQELPETVRLPMEVDPDEGVPYVSLTPLREAIEGGAVAHEPSTTDGATEPSEGLPEVDTAEVDMERVRELLPSESTLKDVARLCVESESILGVSRGLRIPRGDARALLREVGLEETVTQVDARPANSGGESA